MADWIDAGFLVPREKTGLVPPRAAVADPWRAAPRPQWARQWVCRIGGKRFGFSVEHPRGGGVLIRRLLAHFEAEPGPCDAHFEVRDTGPHEAAILCDGVELLRSGDVGMLLGAISQGLIERAHEITSWYAMIHGGAVSLGNRAVGFPAPSGNGKTTLVAGMLAVGFDYLGDDLMAISAPDGKVMPWPMPLSVKSGSWKVIEALHPRFASQPSFEVRGMEARLLAPPAGAWERSGVPLTALVFPTYRANADTVFEPLATFDALVRLVNDRVWLGYPLTGEAIERFLKWLRTIPCHSLEYSRLDEAEQIVRSVLTK